MNSKDPIRWILFASIFAFSENVSGNIFQQTPGIGDSATTRQINDANRFFEELENSAVLKDSMEKFLDLESGEIYMEFDSITRLKYLEAYRGYFDNNIRNYQHSQQVFKWQLTSSKLIFITVIILVMAGIVFSGLQFKRGTSDSKTEFEFSRHGFKVSSSILGVIILVISLAFFYLYLVYVYPIQEIF